ncbi:MAG: isoaspartyl peptidase/L-asparaginase [Balneolaceae bacterium]
MNHSVSLSATLLSPLFLVLFLFTACSGNQEEERVEWSLALHGGAGTISQDMPDSVKQQYYDGLEQAVRTGQVVLREGGSALDAVERVVNNLENNPLFNAGRGAVFTADGTHELDAAIMDGSTMQAGALTGLTTVRNPISLARQVMEESDHIFFSGEGAEQYADQTDIERVENSYFSTENRRSQWERSQQQSLLPEASEPPYLTNPNLDFKYGTVGAVAIDSNGNLAAATSTGGMTNKQFGRVGDVPIIGSGTFANHVAAISATGWGEKIMEQVSANTIANRMEFAGDSLEEAVNFVLNERLQPDEAGFIAVDRDRNIYMNMNTPGMFRGSINSLGEKEVKIWEEE